MLVIQSDAINRSRIATVVVPANTSNLDLAAARNPAPYILGSLISSGFSDSRWKSFPESNTSTMLVV